MKKTIQIDSAGQVSLKKTRQLTPKQVMRFKAMDTSNGQRYLLSLLGLEKKPIMIFNKPTPQNKKLAPKPGRFLTLMQNARDNSQYVDHKPLPKGEWRGVEIECIIPEEVASECDNCGGSGLIPQYDEEDNHSHDDECSACGGSGNVSSTGRGELYGNIRRALTHARIFRASVRSDGSVSGEGAQGVEITLLINIAGDGYAQLEKLCSLMKRQFNATVNTTCGMHVHFDYSKKTSEEVRTAATRAKKFLPMLALLVPPSRRGNTYCALSVSKFRGGRYHAINLTSFAKHGSIEVRLHGGTIDADKIKNWIMLLGLIFATPVTGRVTNMQDVLDKLPVNDELATYLDERFQKFNPVRVTAPTPVPVPAPFVPTPIVTVTAEPLLTEPSAIVVTSTLTGESVTVTPQVPATEYPA